MLVTWVVAMTCKITKTKTKNMIGGTPRKVSRCLPRAILLWIENSDLIGMLKKDYLILPKKIF
jgi:hypothetical protein